MRQKPRDMQELERQAKIKRTEEPRPTQSMIRKMERKMLGRGWGRKREKMEGWPK